MIVALDYQIIAKRDLQMLPVF